MTGNAAVVLKSVKKGIYCKSINSTWFTTYVIYAIGDAHDGFIEGINAKFYVFTVGDGSWAYALEIFHNVVESRTISETLEEDNCWKYGIDLCKNS